MDELKMLLQESLGRNLYQMTVSGPKHNTQECISKRKIRPVMLKGVLAFQVTSYKGQQVFHENHTAQETAQMLEADMTERFKQLQIDTAGFGASVLASKKGKITIRKKVHEKKQAPVLSHNRKKHYVLEEGIAVPFLVDLGVQTKEGKVVASRYDKFRQINRFLEFIEDIWQILPKDRPVHIVDFGCGKSYLTFAMYYYLHELKGLELEVTGLDLKKDVIAHCNELAERYGYEGLHFLHGDIADYTGTDRADMVVTLHACDTATDYALYKAIKWQARVILSVPCCQHEVNRQISCGALDGALRYGLIKERLSALFTDALRADLLEENGYDTQVLEFIDMEHTPKNILLRAVRRKNASEKKDAGSRALAETLGISTTLQKLLKEEEENGIEKSNR